MNMELTPGIYDEDGNLLFDNKSYEFNNPSSIPKETKVYSYIGAKGQAFMPREFDGSNFVGIDIVNTNTAVMPYFDNCPNLKAVFLPASVDLMSLDSFCNTPNLEAIYMDDRNPSFSSHNGVLYNKDFSKLYRFPAGKKELSFHPWVKEIGGHAFAFCHELNCLIIPEGVKDIHLFAFGGVKTKMIFLPDSLETCAGIAGPDDKLNFYYSGRMPHIERLLKEDGHKITSKFTLDSLIDFFGFDETNDLIQDLDAYGIIKNYDDLEF